MARRGAPAALALALVAASLASGRAHAAAPARAIENEACACVFEHLLLERLDATGVQGDAPSPSPASSAFLRSTGCAPARADARRRASCLAPACAELCAPDPRGAVAPRGRRPPPDPSAEDDALATLCELCEAHAPRASSNHALRVDPLWGAWTYGWYASWLVFVAVDAVVAASRPQHSPEGVGGVPYYWGNHPAPADASDAPVILPDVVGPFDQPQAHPTPAYYLIDDLGAALGLSTVPAPPPPPPSPPPPSPSPPSPPPPGPAAAAAPPSAAASSPLCSPEAFAAALSSAATTLLPCLSSASAPCCDAIVQVVGPPAAKPTLPDCLCDEDAFDTLAGALAPAGVDVSALLAECNEAHDAHVGVHGEAACAGYGERHARGVARRRRAARGRGA